jgi:hypothetical protein
MRAPEPQNSQNLMATKRKTAKTRKTGNRPAPQTTKSERKEDVSLPPPEWLAEMASRLFNKDARQIRIGCGGLDVRWVEASRQGLAAYKAAHHVLHYEKLNRQIETEVNHILETLRPQLTEEEISRERVEYFKACKLITGEERKDRADDRFTKLTYWLYSEAYWLDEYKAINEPPPAYHKQGFIRLREMAELKRQFAEMEKIPKKDLVQTLSQFGLYSRPPEEKTGQKKGKS